MKNNPKKIKHGRGGVRRGAGRPKGSPNKASAAREAAIKASGLTPLDYLLGVVRDQGVPRDARLEAARAAAPYVHPKLATIEHRGPGGGPIQHAVAAADISKADAMSAYLKLVNREE